MLSVSGCRGIVGESLTPEVAARFAAAYGSFLRARSGQRPVTVVVGRDGRAGGGMIHNAALSGLLAAGCRVVDAGIATTPTTAVLTDAYARGEPGSDGAGPYVAGMVLTASHNPQQWNGLKCLLAEHGDFGSAACAPPAAFAEEIISRFKAGGAGLYRPWSDVGTVTTDATAVESHVDRLMRALDECGLTGMAAHLASGIRVAVDSVNGSGSIAARVLLESIGCDEILQLNNDASGLFPHPPEPTAENLGMEGGLCEAVARSECDIGFAQDPDADRLAIVDERGTYIGEEYTLAMGAMALLEVAAAQGQASGALLVTNLSTSRMLEDVAARYGARVVRTPVGEANVVEAMKKGHSLVGGEGNGGVIWPRVAYVRDSLSAMALAIWLMAPNGAGGGQKRRLSEIVASLPSYSIQKRKVDLRRREDADPAVAKVASAYGSHRLDTQDGVRVDFGNSWLHVRASNTEPIMRLIAEAPTPEASAAILDEAARVIAS